jgi:hypothetical protein
VVENHGEPVAKVNTLLPRYAALSRARGPSDARSVDVAFISDDTKLEVALPLVDSLCFHEAMRRNGTREIVKLQDQDGDRAQGGVR